MALAVVRVGGNISTSANNITSDTWTSVSGSLIVAIGNTSGISGAFASADTTDTFGNTYTLLGISNNGSGGPGIGFWINDGGTRGSQTVTCNPAEGFLNLGIIEITGHSAGAAYDSTTAAAATDGTNPLDVTAAAAISGNQIAIYAVCIDSASNSTFTNPSGYTDINEQGTGSTSVVHHNSYKINETGTPTVGCSFGGVIVSAREALVTFKEAGGGGGPSVKAGAGIVGP